MADAKKVAAETKAKLGPLKAAIELAGKHCDTALKGPLPPGVKEKSEAILKDMQAKVKQLETDLKEYEAGITKYAANA